MKGMRSSGIIPIPTIILHPKSAILSMLMLADFGWRIMVGIGMIPLLLIPFIIRYLPESIQFLLSRNRQEEVNQILNRSN